MFRFNNLATENIMKQTRKCACMTSFHFILLLTFVIIIVAMFEPYRVIVPDCKLYSCSRGDRRRRQSQKTTNEDKE